MSESPGLMNSLTKAKMILDSPKRDLRLATGRGRHPRRPQLQIYP